jgi:hypothetical protein
MGDAMSETAEERRRVRWNWRVAGIVVALLVVIAGAVVVVDAVSIRNRNFAPPVPAAKR